MESPNTMKARVSAKGWVVIPAVLRKRFGIKPGTSIEFQEAGERIVLIPGTKDPVDEFYGKLAGKISLTDALLEERTKEVRREQARLRTG
jgi:AbrB family looped-hinge helix DNA binding protein